jgi:hypothetical protein
MIVLSMSAIRQGKFAPGIAAAFTAIGIMLGGCTTTSMTTSSTYEWDLSQSNSILQVGTWPDPSSTAFSKTQGQYAFKIKLPNGRSIDHTVARFSVLREGDRIDNIRLISAPLNAKEAEALAVELARKQNLDTTRFAKWAAEVAGPKTTFTPSAFVETRNENPSLVIQTGPSFNDERPWLIHLNVYWSTR